MMVDGRGDRSQFGADFQFGARDSFFFLKKKKKNNVPFSRVLMWRR